MAPHELASRQPWWTKLSKEQRTNIEGYLFILPVVLGLLIFTLGPMVASLYLSFTKFPILKSPEWVGLRNYIVMLTQEKYFWQSVRVTATYAVTAVPLGILGSFLLAMLLDQRIKGIAFFRTCFYMPTIVPALASAVLWGWLLNPDYGLVNAILRRVGLPTSTFLSDPKTALGSLVLMSLWGVGGGMVIYLAGLQGISQQLYEAGRIDGANSLQLFRHITIPLMTPTIFFNLVLGVIAALQVFTQAFILVGREGGPNHQLLFYVMHLYNKAFIEYNFGYGAALAWILFAIIMVFTLLIIRSSALWVYYEGERQS